MLKMSVKILIVLSLLMIQTTYSQTVSLNGEWDFITDPNRELTVNSLENINWRIAVVPLSWQAQFTDLRDYQGIAWYRKIFSVDEIDDSKVFLLKFNAVDYLSKLYINKNFVGQNEGGYTPFEFDITQFLHSGENEIVLRVMDPMKGENPTEGISFWHIPHGKQTWYVQNSGIWQNVSLSIKPFQHVKQLHITPTNNGNVVFDGNISKTINEVEEIRIQIIDPNGIEVLNERRTIRLIDNTFHFEEVISNPLLWSFDSPNLYTITLMLGENSIDEKFGFRSIEAKNSKLYLNGKPLYLIAALDQDYYPETIYTTPSEEYLHNEMMKAKQLGLNMLRCHIKVPDPLYLKVADEVGLLVWYEVPNWGEFTNEAAARGSRLLDKMLERDWNHPSLVILSLINESWGIDLQKKEQRAWLLKEFDRVKQKAVGRLVVDNSVCWGNFHLKTDINDYHTYWAIPENKNQFDKTIKEVAARPKWLFSEFGDSQESGDEPLLISEFGNWGLPKLPERLPWWFERQFLDIEVSMPKGTHDRFIEHNLDRVFENYNKLAEESQRAQFRALKYEIEKLRMTPEIQGYVITEFTDINWESNGLLDMWRNFKIYADELQLIQQQDVIIPRPVKYNYWSGEEIQIDLYISHYSNRDLADQKLEWNLGDEINGSIDIGGLISADVTKVNSLKLTLPEVLKSEKVKIDLKLIDKNGNEIAKNFVELFVFKKPEEQKREISVYDPANNLNSFSNSLSNDHYLSESSDIVIAIIIDSKVLDMLKKGKSIICLVDSTTKLPEFFTGKIISRNEEWLDGNWATNLNWLRDDNLLFNDISFEKTFGFEISQTIPKIVLTEIPPENFEDVLAGMFVGWLHKNSAYVFQIKAGKGNLIFCTFPLAENYPTDPFAKRFLQNLISYIQSDQFKPSTIWTLN